MARLMPLGRPVVPDAGSQLVDGLAVAGQTLFQHLVVRIRRRTHEVQAACLETIPTFVQVFAGQRDVLNTLAIERHQVFLDLARAF